MAPQRDEIYRKLRVILAETLGADEEEITWDTNVYDDLNADVLEFHDDVMHILEKTFDVKLDDEDIADLTTVRELVDYLAENA